ncbi:hypothetical protein ACIBEJ_13955 [Nonomuraea sp. NPDC050790]|uniref:hypothetical protein n=1 Tax=Nonomuraea sp. NPDC050790 TaxID=3364371 RepID=UPI00378B5FC1
MAPAQRSCRRQKTPLACKSGPDIRDGRTVYVEDLTPEELEAFGPEANPEPPPPPSWTREEYRALLIARGVRESKWCDAAGYDAAGYDGYLELAEAHGFLEKRPNTEPWDLLIAEQEEDE